MTIRRLSAFVPLALLVGAVVHVATAGFDHAPGGRLAPGLFLVVGLALCAAVAAAWFAGALGSRRTSIATSRESVYASLGLALAGTAAFALLELADAHLSLGGALRALAVSLPVALLVRTVAYRAARSARSAGSRFADALRARRSPARSVLGSSGRRRTRAHRRPAVASRRGRAPPLFA